MNYKPTWISRFNHGIPALTAIVLCCVLAASELSAQGQRQYIYNTASVWNTEDGIVANLGPDGLSTFGETLVAPDVAGVTLTSFTFYAQSDSIDGVSANLDLEAFVYSWSGGVGGSSGGAVGKPLYLSPAFTYSPPPRTGSGFAGPWTPLTVSLGAGVSLNPGQPLVIGVTISDPTCYAASSGDIEFQFLGTYQIPAGTVTGGGGFVGDNNGNDFAALNNGAWTAGGGGDEGCLAFTANFTAVPEPPIAALALVGVLAWRVKSIFSRQNTGVA